MALKGEEISSAKNQTLLVKVQQPLRKTPESRAPENPTSPHVWPIQNVCLPQHISTSFYPFRWSQLIDHERALSTDSREGRPFVQTTRTGSKANKRSLSINALPSSPITCLSPSFSFVRGQVLSSELAIAFFFFFFTFMAFVRML